jgi:RNA polymerase sigma-70 factor (ECF subfamily)
MTLSAASKPPPTLVAAEPSDEELVGLLRDGAASAGEILVRRHVTPLMRYLQRLVGNDQLAEELHQQTWLSVLDHLDRFDAAASTGGGGFKAWLFRIATNKANDFWRSSGREKSARLGMQLVAPDAAAPPDGRLNQLEQTERLRRAIERLPDSQRQVLMLRYYSNLKFIEIADVLGCPLNTALGRMHKAMLKLREMLQD